MKNRIIDYFILFVGGCLIFTVAGGMVVGLLKLILGTASSRTSVNTTVTTKKKSTGMNTRVAIAATVNTPNTK